MNVVFDLDDTIHDKSASLEKCGGALFEEYLSETEINRQTFVESFVRENYVIQAKVEVFRKLALAYSFPERVETEMLDRFDNTFHQFSERFDYVSETFSFLRNEGVQIACLTNGRDFFQRNKISALGLEEYFEVIITSGEFGVKKPDQAIFKFVIDSLQVNAGSTVFVGDSLKADMIPAKKLGLITVWKTDDKTTNPEYVDFKLSHFREFRKLWEAISLGAATSKS